VTDKCLVSLADATDAGLCGGKASGLAHLERGGFTVPGAICLTTAFYRRWLEASGISPGLTALITKSATRAAKVRRKLLAEVRHRIEAASLPADLGEALGEGITDLRMNWDGALCVRSSAVHEDHGAASHAGIHASFVVAEPHEPSVVTAIKRCWASLWTEPAWTYRDRLGIPHAQAAMAVVVQRFIPADRAGVAFSADPLTGDHATVVIEAGFGTGEALVSGKITPDHYRVTVEDGVPVRVRRDLGRDHPMTLTEAQALDLARLVKAVERNLGAPVDVEWVFDGREFWAVQARPITALGLRREDSPEPGTMWTRANLKEVFPELPSPLALSYLTVSLNSMFSSYHAAQGYPLPPQARLVSVFRGRPYLNLTLMQQLTLERGGDPTIVTRLFGGTEAATRTWPAATSRPRGGFANAARLTREMLATFFRTPYRGRRLFQRMRRQATALRAMALDSLDDRALVAHLERFGATALHERTVRRLHEVVSAQSRAYMALERLMAAWIDSDSETVMKRLMTGLGTLPNVRMTYSLMALGGLAAADPRARAFFAGELDAEAIRGYEAALADTRLLAEFQAFLGVFGHRGPYESDVMSARFCEDPAPLLRLIQLYVRAGTADPAQHAAERHAVRQAATDEVRRALREGRGWLAFWVRWIVFSIMCGALRRLLALRDECRHVTTLLVAHLRRVTLEMGRRAARDGALASPEDAFFVTWDELPRLLIERRYDWRRLVLGRRRERERHERLAAPDLLGSDAATSGVADAPHDGLEDEIRGLGVSPGTVTGRVKVFRAGDRVRSLSGEIVVFPAIEPTLAPIFPLVRGIVAEMGGLLSHAAILAREYGLPAVVSVPDAMRRLHDGDRIELDGATGRIRVLERGDRRVGSGSGLNRLPVAEQDRSDHDPDRRAGNDVGHVVPLEVDPPHGHGGGEHVERPAKARIKRGEDGGHREDRRRMP